MINQNPKVLFAVVHYSGRENYLLRTLASIYSQEYPQFSVLVGESSTSDDLGEMLKSKFPGLIYLKKNSYTGKAAARNFLLEYILPLDYEFIFMLDNDIELDKYCLVRLLDAIRADPSIGLAAPMILNEDGSALSSGGAYLRLLGQPVLRQNLDEKTTDMDFATGTIGLIRIKALQAVGSYDTILDPYGFEDIDYCLRLKQKGFSIRLDRESHCLHISRYSFHHETEYSLYNTTKNRLLCAFKHVPPFFFIALFFPWYLSRRVAFPSIKFLLMGKVNLSTAVIKGFVDGLRSTRSYL